MPNPNSRQKFGNLDHGRQQPEAGQEGNGADESAEATGETEAEDDGVDAQQEQAKYTDKDLDDIISKRLARERSKIERELRAQIAKEDEDAQTEAEKLRGMTDLQRAQHEARKLKEENLRLKAQHDLAEQMAIARSELSEAGISMGDELLAMFVSPEAEKTGAAIDRIKELWPKAVNEAVQRELRRDAPPAPRGKGKKSFGASYAEEYSKRMNGGK